MTWEESLEVVVRRRGTALLRYGFLLCGDPVEAEDLVQDAVTRTYATGRRDLDAGQAEGYIRRAMVNAVIDGSRRRRRWDAVRHVLVRPGVAAGPDDDAPGRVDVERALAALKPRERACVVLRFYEDMTVPRIAECLGLSEGAIKRYLSDGTRAMERLLGAQDDALAHGSGRADANDEIEVDVVDRGRA